MVSITAVTRRPGLSGSTAASTNQPSTSIVLGCCPASWVGSLPPTARTSCFHRLPPRSPPFWRRQATGNRRFRLRLWDGDRACTRRREGRSGRHPSPSVVSGRCEAGRFRASHRSGLPRNRPHGSVCNRDNAVTAWLSSGATECRGWPQGEAKLSLCSRSPA